MLVTSANRGWRSTQTIWTASDGGGGGRCVVGQGLWGGLLCSTFVIAVSHGPGCAGGVSPGEGLGRPVECAIFDARRLTVRIMGRARLPVESLLVAGHAHRVPALLVLRRLQVGDQVLAERFKQPAGQRPHSVAEVQPTKEQAAASCRLLLAARPSVPPVGRRPRRRTTVLSSRLHRHRPQRHHHVALGRMDNALDQRRQLGKPDGLLVKICVAVIDAFNAGDHVAHDALSMF